MDLGFWENFYWKEIFYYLFFLCKDNQIVNEMDFMIIWVRRTLFKRIELSITNVWTVHDWNIVVWRFANIPILYWFHYTAESMFIC